MTAAPDAVLSTSAAEPVEVLTQLSDGNTHHRGHRLRAGQAEAVQGRVHPDLPLQPRIGIGVATAILTAGGQRQAAGLARDGSDAGATLSGTVTGQHRTCPHREFVVVGSDHQGPVRGVADLVQHGGRAPEHLGDGSVSGQ